VVIIKKLLTSRGEMQQGKKQKQHLSTRNNVWGGQGKTLYSAEAQGGKTWRGRWKAGGEIIYCIIQPTKIQNGYNSCCTFCSSGAVKLHKATLA
jgi:hypothetical protein